VHRLWSGTGEYSSLWRALSDSRPFLQGWREDGGVLEMDQRTLHMLVRLATIELHPQPPELFIVTLSPILARN
jgi:hypothetical protein